MNKLKVHAENGTIAITSKVAVNASKDRIWSALKNIDEIEKFHPLVKKSYAISKEVSGLGAERFCELKPMGSMVEEVVEWNEGKSIVFAVKGGKMLPPFRFMKGKIGIEELDGQAKIEFTLSYQLKYGILGRVLDYLFIRRQFKMAPFKYVNGLKNYVEVL